MANNMKRLFNIQFDHARKRQRYLTPLIKLFLHAISVVGLFVAAYLCLIERSWVPIAIYLLLLAGMEGFYWYDTYIGWSPRVTKRSADEQ